MLRLGSNYFEAGATEGNDLVEVFVNGERRPHCTRAHAGQGWATSYVLGDDGIVVRDGLGRAKVRTEHGKVELRDSNGDPFKPSTNPGTGRATHGPSGLPGRRR